MNDPNGLVYAKGEYHLFFQYNPLGLTWGHMSWGHAVSRDLLRWTQLPVALPETDGLMAFSGSAVEDTRNTAGFGPPGSAPLVAIYTGHDTRRPHQAQRLAYSLDRGLTWTPYPGNPVLDRALSDFRDPNVFWYESGACWVMAGALPNERRIAFYRSPDLKQWTLLSEFGPAGATLGVWECPDLMALPVRGQPGEVKWVLAVSVSQGAPNGGSGCQYFVGSFDGTTFTPGEAGGPPQWADYGRDFYAAVSWSGVTTAGGRRLWLGWLNNWDYGQEIPTSPWRSVQSLMRELEVLPQEGRWVLGQRPYQLYGALRTDAVTSPPAILQAGPAIDPPGAPRGRTLELGAELWIDEGSEAGISVFRGSGCETRIGYDGAKAMLYVDRTRSGPEFKAGFAGRHEAPLVLNHRPLVLRVFLDRSTIEVFAADGAVAMSDQVFPPPGADGVAVYCARGKARLTRLQAWTLRSIWGP
jgi:fructan beta-fructosidase